MTDAEKLKAVVELVKTHDQEMNIIGGCGDGNCIVKRPIGMHTNGGCNCYKDVQKVRRVMTQRSFFVVRLGEILKGK